MATVTDPIILDSTGQDIVTALGNLNTPRDTAAYTTSFASSDTDDASATSWTVVTPIAGGETHATLFGKLSQIAKNVRYLYKTLGNTDLSAIGGGTVTDIIASMFADSGITGYYIFPSGLKLYASSVSVTTSATGSGSFTYYGYTPVTFPVGVSFTTVFGGYSNINANAGYQNSTVRNLTTTGCNVYAASNGENTYGVTYVIIGK